MRKTRKLILNSNIYSKLIFTVFQQIYYKMSVFASMLLF